MSLLRERNERLIKLWDEQNMKMDTMIIISKAYEFTHSFSSVFMSNDCELRQNKIKNSVYIFWQGTNVRNKLFTRLPTTSFLPSGGQSVTAMEESKPIYEKNVAN